MMRQDHLYDWCLVLGMFGFSWGLTVVAGGYLGPGIGGTIAAALYAAIFSYSHHLDRRLERNSIRGVDER